MSLGQHVALVAVALVAVALVAVALVAVVLCRKPLGVASVKWLLHEVK